jgi:fatty acid-binding protein DegV
MGIIVSKFGGSSTANPQNLKRIDRLVRAVEELGDDVKNHRIVIGHTGAPDIAKEIETALRARLGDDLNIETVITNPTAGAHCGPNGAGVSFHAKSRI